MTFIFPFIEKTSFIERTGTIDQTHLETDLMFLRLSALMEKNGHGCP